MIELKNNKKSTRKKIKKKNDKLSKDITGTIIIAIGILTLFSLFSVRMGLVGSMIHSASFSLMGFGAYLLPVAIIGMGLIFLLDKLDFEEKKIAISIIILLISILVIFDGVNKQDFTFIDRIKNAINLGQSRKGGGIIGSIFGFFFYNLFGSIGAYIVIGFIIAINILLMTNIKIKDILKKFENNSKRIKESSKPIINHKIPTNSKEEDLKVIDYSKGINKKAKEVLKEKDEVNDISVEIEVNQHRSSTNTYTIPPISLLKTPATNSATHDRTEVLNKANIIQETMKNFGIEAKILEINVGPTITCYELQPSPGIKLSRIVSLSDNIALSLASSDIRIEAPIPGKSAVGIEVPNKVKDSVFLKEIILSKEYKEMDSGIPLALGKNVSGDVIVSTIDKMPHLLIAGATGSGKSVCINTIIMSILYKSSPEDVKLLLIDPKMVELSVYNGIPHLLIPVVTDAKKASFALNWAVNEMEKRYKMFAQNNVRDIISYNNKFNNKEEQLPSIVIIIDELADLMMVAAQEIEDYICRLAQMARAAGMYLIVATQRPSVDVITGTIKANIPSRISFAVSSQVDSRTILDMSGAEKLLGKGDMLFYPSFYSKPTRIQGAFISEEEVQKVVNSLKEQNITEYNEDIIEVIQNPQEFLYDDSDELLPEAISLVVKEGQASISLLQRRLKIGYARAARIVDEMEERGVIGGYEGSKPRKVLITQDDLESVVEER